MPRITIILAIGCLLAIPLIASGEQYHLLDPVTTYTNGMPLASSTTLRNHNVYYQCDPDRVGCCGGRYVMPCWESLLYPDHCCTGARPAPPEAFGPQTTLGSTAHVEPVQFEQLGSIPGVPVGLPIGAAAQR